MTSTPDQSAMQSGDRHAVGHAAATEATLNPSTRKQTKSPAAKSPKQKKEKIARPMNSFMIFARDFRAEMREKFPDIDNKDISKMLGQKWKTLGPAEKKIYYDKAREVAEQHKKDHPDWKFVRAPPRKGKGKKGDKESDEFGSSEDVHMTPSVSISDDGRSVMDLSTPRSVPSPSTVLGISGYRASLNPEHIESLRDLQVAQSKLMLEQQEMEIAVLMAGQGASPNVPPPSYVSPPPLKNVHGQDSVFLSAMELAMMSQAGQHAGTSPRPV
jgi:hypothetical protein